MQLFKNKIATDGFSEGLASGTIPSTITREALETPLARHLAAAAGPAGWGLKRGEILLKTWKRRWFMIRSGCLLYFKSRKPDELPIGLFLLGHDIHVVRAKPGWIKMSSDTGPLVSYKLLGDGTLEKTLRDYVFICTEVESEANDWMAAMM